MDIREEITLLLGGVLQDEDLVLILTVDEGGQLLHARRGSILEALELLRQTEDKSAAPQTTGDNQRTWWHPSKPGAT